MVIALLDMGSLKSSTLSGSSNYLRTPKPALSSAYYLSGTHFRGNRKSGHAESETGGHAQSEMTGHLPEMGGHAGLKYAISLVRLAKMLQKHNFRRSAKAKPKNRWHMFTVSIRVQTP
jgi:hypothetical protein